MISEDDIMQLLRLHLKVSGKSGAYIKHFKEDQNMIKAKKTEEKTSISYDVKVTRAAQYKENTFAFDMVVNGITVYGCWFKQGKDKTGKDYTFVDFPSRKGNDGNYYNHAWFPINKDLTAEIESQIAALL